jgi:hypothetical protein
MRLDRRPLDPPPVLLVKFFIFSAGTENKTELEVNYESVRSIDSTIDHSRSRFGSDVQVNGLMCTAE